MSGKQQGIDPEDVITFNKEFETPHKAIQMSIVGGVNADDG